jgi:uncharacterized protein YraI
MNNWGGMNVNVFSCSRRELARLAIGAAVVIGGLSAAPLGTAAQDDVSAAALLEAGQTAVVSDGPLNLRTGAGTGYAVIEQLATGDYVEVQSGPISADGYQWNLVLVDATGSTGYVASAFLTPVNGNGFSIGDTVSVNTDALNVRSGPGTGYSVIDTIGYGANGLVVDGPVFANGYTWYEIDYVGGSSDGWVASDFLSLATSGGGFAVGDLVAVDSASLNVRSGPGTGYAVIDTLSSGDQGVVLDGPVSANGYTWYQVNYSFGGYTGWVAGEYLTYVSGGGFAIGDNVSITTNDLNVRSGPGTGYAVIDTLNVGNQGVVLDGPVSADGYTWYEINYSYGGYSGWVAGEYLALS